MTIATAGTGGFGGDAAAEGPNAGYDPVMKFRKKLKKKKKRYVSRKRILQYLLAYFNIK